MSNNENNENKVEVEIRGSHGNAVITKNSFESHLIKGKEIGRGAYGIVYKGKYFGIDVAIKVLNVAHHEKFDYDYSISHESDMLISMRHPNIILLMGVYEDKEKGEFNIIEEFGENGPLTQWVIGDTKKLSWIRKLQICKEISGALLYMHSQGFVHRDLKAENILLDKFKKTKLADFGLARKIVHDETEEREKMTDKVGTLWWRAPEIDKGEDYGTEVDIFSLGILILEIITGQNGDDIRLELTVIGKDPKTKLKTFFGVDNTRVPELITQYSDDCPPPLVDLVTRCINEDPKQRPTIQEVVAELDSTYETADNLICSVKEGIEDKNGVYFWLSLRHLSEDPTTVSLTTQILYKALNDHLHLLKAPFNENNIHFFDTLIGDVDPENVSPSEFNSLWNHFIQQSKILTNNRVKLLYTNKIVEGFITSAKADEILSQKEDGHCIIRFGVSQPGSLVIVYKRKGKLLKKAYQISDIGIVLMSRDQTYYPTFTKIFEYGEEKLGWKYVNDIEIQSPEFQAVLEEIDLGVEKLTYGNKNFGYSVQEEN
eukprot:TRINITY_DN999_c0_g1_i1.p1 TRINITY_DN999_c0_g1~~TRINITY_DN999_c0_g1_i1.p1  ORF type:complete len:543 (+),score=197.77 TRINITY_DN999_c0_g1_i1:52-1680(+)